MPRVPDRRPVSLHSTSLNAARRARELAEIAETTVDVLVVGLGATGAGAALDAASRGLSVAAIDAHDLAFGTSRWSSKLIHGGLRYLAKGQVGVAMESAVERGILLTTTAPHLVRARPYLLPLTPAVSRSQAATLMAGYRLGDALRAAARTPRRLLPGPSGLGAARALERVPGLAPRGLRGALLSWDGRVIDDARLVVAIARTAAGHGARILTRCRAVELTGDGAEARDELTGERLRIRARTVVNATGVWAGTLDPSITLRPSRGAHLVLGPGVLATPGAGMHVPIPGESNRFVLVLPQSGGRVYVGLTDEPVDGPVPDVPEVPESDVTFLLDVLNSVLAVPVRRSDVAGAYAGLRPLLAAPDGAEGATADLSRRHAVRVSQTGVVTVVGGKLTTYRRMAEDAVDRAVALRSLQAGPSPTSGLPLVGAPVGALRAPWWLVERYGAEAPAVAELAEADPSLAEPVAPGVIGAELVWGARHEGALDAGDLLDRRTRIGLIPAEREAALPAALAALAATGE
ncbi:glycerol-3-phosphate dehydrogenase/oxidase [Spongiactinospora sp. TRM90649]|uniref:glycerol-3-phosphate dehydrogenase/oxidase n=1 Tax=Spongiactinospora sp. TRM90649 TaxID=3031114 RepID=UPI0023F84CE0|nr:glycerol-3-phosphate dehydrogenase/oxidase [Spongiactinospora sp. TRM90649]MDF5757867.1 glycerol-3-phosphate dehydrogenase/oxidase [Spongiactinospora sp. TRM90649]